MEGQTGHGGRGAARRGLKGTGYDESEAKQERNSYKISHAYAKACGMLHGLNDSAWLLGHVGQKPAASASSSGYRGKRQRLSTSVSCILLSISSLSAFFLLQWPEVPIIVSLNAIATGQKRQCQSVNFVSSHHISQHVFVVMCIPPRYLHYIGCLPRYTCLLSTSTRQKSTNSATSWN